MLAPDLCHRESEFFDLQDEARQRLLAVYGIDPAEWCAVLMTASGTGAVESMVSTLVPQEGARAGGRERRVRRADRADLRALPALRTSGCAGDWMQALDLAGIAQRLEDAPHDAVRASRTSPWCITRRRPAGSTICARSRTCAGSMACKLLLDAVSSFGAEPLDFADESLAAAAATANKCLHGVPGVAFVIVRRRALERAASRTYYLDLARCRSGAGPAQYAVHARRACALRAGRGAARARGAGRMGGAPPAVCRAGRAGARRPRRARHRRRAAARGVLGGPALVRAARRHLLPDAARWAEGARAS